MIRRTKWYDRAISLFLILNLAAILAWCSPFTNLPVLISRVLARPYLVFTGLFQSWDMFSPAPKRTNSYLEAMLVYPDGTTEYWEYPRMDRLSFRERYVKERYRKFVEYVFDDKYSDILPDVARYIARQAVARGSKRPEMVMLIENRSDLVQNPDGSFNDLPWQSRVFYRYRLDPEDFN
jgi:hypothetical protein